MTRRLEAQDLTHAALSLNAVSDNNFQVVASGAVLGEIIARRRSFGRVVWFWSLSGPHLPESMQGSGSNATTLEGAKAALKSSLDSWLQSATGQPGDVQWSRKQAG